MYRSVLVAVSALAGLAYAQSIPTCAQSCIVIPASCPTADPSCICNDQQWISDLSCCVAQNCEESDQQAALAYGNTICTPVGATLPSQASCAGNSTSSASSSSASSSGSSTASSSTGGALSSITSSLSSGVSSATASASSAASAAASSASAAASSASGSNGMQLVAPAAGGILGAIVGFVALL